MSHATTPAFRMTNGWVSYDGSHALRGVDVRMDPGEVVAVLGANGSGKSTLIRALLGLVPLSAGSAELYGVSPQRFSHWARIGYVPQRLTVGGGVPATVREVVSSGRIARHRWFGWPGSRTKADRTAVHRALEAMGLADLGGRAVATLSGGQQQRVLIARALAGEPDTFVMDEPTAGVDAGSQRSLAGALRELVQQRKQEEQTEQEEQEEQEEHRRTIVLVAHELGPLESLVTRTVCLADGRVTWDGPPRAGDTRPGAEPEHPHPHPHTEYDAGEPLRAWGHHR